VPGSRLADSPLTLEDVRLGAGELFALGDDDQDSLLFAYEGSGLMALAGESHRLEARHAALVLAGERAAVTGDDGGIAFVRAVVGLQADRHAPLGERQVIAALDGAGSDVATGSRSFEVLFGPHNGSTRATLFMGFVPPGKAPWHFHLYDEIVWIPQGPGRLHLESRVEELGQGSSFRLRPRELHIVENTGSDTLEVLGVFSPAGTPSAAYLPPEIAAAYSFVG
jgi:mannose-6-phosphate isomerase-like protein (cupin superfamily)